MVRAREEKLRAARNRAELADDQPIPIDGIVIQHIVLFKPRRVVNKVVVYRVVANDDIRVCDNVLKYTVVASFVLGYTFCSGIAINASRFLF